MTSSMVAGGLADDDLERRLFVEEGQAEVPPDGLGHKAEILGVKGIVEPQFSPDDFPFRRGHPFSDQIPDRVPDLVLDGKTHQADNQHHQDGLNDSSRDKGEHGATLLGRGRGGLSNRPGAFDAPAFYPVF